MLYWLLPFLKLLLVANGPVTCVEGVDLVVDLLPAHDEQLPHRGRLQVRLELLDLRQAIRLLKAPIY